jgi:hypothetical protein
MSRRDSELAYLALEIVTMSVLEGRTYWKLGAAGSNVRKGSKDGKGMVMIKTGRDAPVYPKDLDCPGLACVAANDVEAVEYMGVEACQFWPQMPPAMTKSTASSESTLVPGVTKGSRLQKARNQNISVTRDQT